MQENSTAHKEIVPKTDTRQGIWWRFHNSYSVATWNSRFPSVQLLCARD